MLLRSTLSQTFHTTWALSIRNYLVALLKDESVSATVALCCHKNAMHWDKSTMQDMHLMIRHKAVSGLTQPDLMIKYAFLICAGTLHSPEWCS